MPAVEVIRRPVANPGTVAPSPTPTASVTPRPTPRPTTPSPGPTVSVTPRPTPRPTPSAPVTPSAPEEATASAPRPIPTPVAPRPTAAPASVAPRPAFPSSRPPGAGGPPGARSGGFARPRTPRPPPTNEQILALAAKEHVPARIAKGELEGKMKCRIWRKLHAEEARRFDQVYALMGQNPGLSLADGFGVLQSGLTVAEFLARKERTQRKAAVKTARGEVDDTSIGTFIQGLVEAKTELAIVLGERTVLDTVTNVEPISFVLGRSGRQEKLQVVMMTRRSDWEQLMPHLERDPKLTQKPVNVARQPDKRPFSDPRPFLAHQGQSVRLTLRNGIQLVMPLRVVGRFDLLLGEDGHEVFVPLHALVRFSAEDSLEDSGDASGENS
ncbi:hypothetical protein [Cystobacter ferrugineus]|uniref:hypothetical protein n=1 Tax=Cystobacter ferrugineus TaxID=83449 RepID=UPI001FE49D09|nr:hypothetical protein [Cystobacter ferrugineus]